MRRGFKEKAKVGESNPRRPLDQFITPLVSPVGKVITMHSVLLRERPGELELDPQEIPGEIKSREVELDLQESPGQIKSREVELGSENWTSF